MTGKIYKIVNDLNNKVYIGQTIQSLQKRFNGHCCKSKSDRSVNMHIKRAILKYGKEHFNIELIEECDISLLDSREIYWISYYNSNVEGYNLTEGGNSNREAMTTALEDRINIEEFKSYIINNFPTPKQVEEKFNICHSSVYNLIKRLGDERLKLNHYNPRKAKEIKDIDSQELLDKYNDGWSILDLTKYFHIRKSKISEYLHSLGIIPRRGKKGYKNRI